MTTFEEWIAEGHPFLLVGGRFDGRTVDPRGYEAWPSFLKMVDPATGEVSRYMMRIGDLEHYDFDGIEVAPSGPEGA